MKGLKKGKNMHVRVSEAESNKYKVTASELGLSVSQLTRFLLNKQVRLLNQKKEDEIQINQNMKSTLERVYERLAKAKPKRRTISKVQRVKPKASSFSAAQERELLTILNNTKMKATKRLQLFTNRVKQIDG